MFDCWTLTAVGHAHDTLFTKAVPLTGKPVGCSDVHADSAIATAAATPTTAAIQRRLPRPRRGPGLAIEVPTDPMSPSMTPPLAAEQRRSNSLRSFDLYVLEQTYTCQGE